MNNKPATYQDGMQPVQEDLLRYIEGRMSAEESAQMEKAIQSSEFLADAFAGLSQFTDIADAKKLAASIDAHLNAELAKRKNPVKRTKHISSTPLIIGIIVILLLVFIAFGLIHYIEHR